MDVELSEAKADSRALELSYVYWTFIGNIGNCYFHDHVLTLSLQIITLS